MTLDEFLALVQSGKVFLAIKRLQDTAMIRKNIQEHNLTLDAQYHISHHLETDRTFEILECLNRHSMEIHQFLVTSDTRICMAPQEHWQHYRKVEDELEDFYECDACFHIRLRYFEGVLEEKAPGGPAKILDLKLRTQEKGMEEK